MSSDGLLFTIMAWVSLCELEELREGQPRYAEVDGFDLAVFLQQGAVHVLDNNCPHAGGNLAAGRIEDGCVVCPLHDWAFHLETGELCGQPGVKVQTYPTRVLERAGKPALVQVALPMY